MSTKIPRGARKTPLNHDPEALSWALRKSGLSQAVFAEQIGKSPGLASEILKGTRNANPALLQKIARVLNCPIVVLEAKLDTDPYGQGQTPARAMTIADARLVYTVEEAADAVRMSVGTIRAAIHATDPASFPPPLRAKLGERKQLLIPADELARWVESLPDV